ncbi:hypothetical protein AB0L70_23205 [Kribbella sp. NPDC051952]|uniref:hypothetical protein n=1 Tax=Kribbella sp. NPDC051952 TaxID=3154851 RepID=UPI0034343E54
MTSTTELEAITSRYLAVWSEPDAAVRRQLLTAIWTPDGVEFVDGAQFRGYDELEARVTEAYEQFVGSGKYTVGNANDATTHDDIVTFTIQLITTDGDLAWAARVFLLLDEGGLVQEDYQLTVKPL